jgi:GntR family transcriptional regulator of arabinose operon
MARNKTVKPKHQQVFDELSRDIATGRYQPGQRFPSEAALVNRFRASRITVGRAVLELQRRGLVERFAGSGTFVRGLSGALRKGMLFGLIIPDLGGTEIFEPICQGIANAPDAAGHALLWPHANGSATAPEEQAMELCEQCITREVSGVFFAPLEMTPRAGEVNRKVMARLKKAGIPTVLLDRRPEDLGSRDRSDLVSVDNNRAGYLATEHLLRCGARRVGFVALRGQASSVIGRIAGYRHALAASGTTSGAVYQLESGEPVQLPAEAARCDGFVCSSDRVAGYLMHHLLAKGVRIPIDVRIAGIDDVRYAALLPVPLTTISQPCREIGETALRMLLERLARPKMPAREVLLDCELVIRQSCGAAGTDLLSHPPR